MHGTNKITTEFASQMMHMHFNGITGDLFVRYTVSLQSVCAAVPDQRYASVIPAGQILLVSVLGFASQRGDTFAGVEHDVTVAQLVAGLPLVRRIRASSTAATSINAKVYTDNRQLPDAALLHVPPAHRARSGSVPAHADLFFSPFAQNIATIHAR